MNTPLSIPEPYAWSLGTVLVLMAVMLLIRAFPRMPLYIGALLGALSSLIMAAAITAVRAAVNGVTMPAEIAREGFLLAFNWAVALLVTGILIAVYMRLNRQPKCDACDGDGEVLMRLGPYGSPYKAPCTACDGSGKQIPPRGHRATR